MTRRLLFAGLVLCLLVGCQTVRQSEYKWATLVLPDGQAGAGRDVFVEMGCASCHQVTWDVELPETVATIAGPRLDRRLARQTTGWIASAIIAPSHDVPEEYEGVVSGDLSPMADYTDAMTVRELIDVVTYLRTQGGGMAALERPFDQERFPHHL